MRIKKFLKKFLKNSRADVSIEFVIILPVIIILFEGIYELTMYSLVHNKLTRVVEVLGNLISSNNVSQATILSYCNQASQMMLPFNFTSSNGQIVVSQVQNVGATTLPANVKISWQVSYNGGGSKFGGVGATTGFPNGLSITGTQAAIIVEAFYTYTPTIFSVFTTTTKLYQVSFYVPRVGQMTTLNAT